MRSVILTVGLAVGLAGTAGEARAQYVLPGSYSSYYPGAYGYDGGAVYGGYTPSYYGYTPALGYGYPAYGYGAGRYGYSGFRYGYGSPYGGYRYGYRYGGYRGYRY